MTIRIAVVDDHPLFREGVTRSLAETGAFEVVGEGSSADDAVRIAESEHPHILLLDISMPGGGLSAIPRVLEKSPDQKIVMLTVSEASEDLAAALERGACGYVLKGVGSRALSEILTAVASGERYVSPALSARLLTSLATAPAMPAKPDPMLELTPREQEILKLVATGLSNKRVALQLALHEKTVKHHMTSIMAKLSVSNRTEAALVFRDIVDGRAAANAPYVQSGAAHESRSALGK